MRFLYSRPVIRRILRQLWSEAAPLVLTTTDVRPCSGEFCEGISLSGVTTAFLGIMAILFLYAESAGEGASGGETAPTFSMKISVSDDSASSKRLMIPPCSSAASTITLGLRSD